MAGEYWFLVSGLFALYECPPINKLLAIKLVDPFIGSESDYAIMTMTRQLLLDQNNSDRRNVIIPVNCSISHS